MKNHKFQYIEDTKANVQDETDVFFQGNLQSNKEFDEIQSDSGMYQPILAKDKSSDQESENQIKDARELVCFSFALTQPVNHFKPGLFSNLTANFVNESSIDVQQLIPVEICRKWLLWQEIQNLHDCESDKIQRLKLNLDQIFLILKQKYGNIQSSLISYDEQLINSVQKDYIQKAFITNQSNLINFQKQQNEILKIDQKNLQHYQKIFNHIQNFKKKYKYNKNQKKSVQNEQSFQEKIENLKQKLQEKKISKQEQEDQDWNKNAQKQFDLLQNLSKIIKQKMKDDYNKLLEENQKQEEEKRSQAVNENAELLTMRVLNIESKNMISPEPKNRRIQSDQIENYLNDNQHGTAKFNYDSPEISRLFQHQHVYPSNDLCISNFGPSSSEIKKKNMNGELNDLINFRDQANADTQNLKIYKIKDKKSTSSGSVKNINCQNQFIFPKKPIMRSRQLPQFFNSYQMPRQVLLKKRMTQQMIKNLSQINLELEEKVSRYDGTSEKNENILPCKINDLKIDLVSVKSNKSSYYNIQKLQKNIIHINRASQQINRQNREPSIMRDKRKMFPLLQKGLIIHNQLSPQVRRGQVPFFAEQMQQIECQSSCLTEQNYGFLNKKSEYQSNKFDKIKSIKNKNHQLALSGAESSYFSQYCHISPEEKMNIQNFYDEFQNLNDQQAQKRFLENTIQKQKNEKLSLKIFETTLYNDNFEEEQSIQMDQNLRKGSNNQENGINIQSDQQNFEKCLTEKSSNLQSYQISNESKKQGFQTSSLKKLKMQKNEKSSSIKKAKIIHIENYNDDVQLIDEIYGAEHEDISSGGINAFQIYQNNPDENPCRRNTINKLNNLHKQNSFKKIDKNKLCGFKLNIEKLYNDMDYFEKSISPQSNAAAIKNNNLQNNLFFLNQHNQMGFSTGGGSQSFSITSTISPEQKSSSNSSLEKKLSPRGRGQVLINVDQRKMKYLHSCVIDEEPIPNIKNDFINQKINQQTQSGNLTQRQQTSGVKNQIPSPERVTILNDQNPEGNQSDNYVKLQDNTSKKQTHIVKSKFQSNCNIDSWQNQQLQNYSPILIRKQKNDQRQISSKFSIPIHQINQNRVASDFKIKLQNTNRGTSDHPDNQSNYADDC